MSDEQVLTFLAELLKDNLGSGGVIIALYSVYRGFMKHVTDVIEANMKTFVNTALSPIIKGQEDIKKEVATIKEDVIKVQATMTAHHATENKGIF